jgi:hypothetical protein
MSILYNVRLLCRETGNQPEINRFVNENFVMFFKVRGGISFFDTSGIIFHYFLVELFIITF